jgi:hypothetical protein
MRGYSLRAVFGIGLLALVSRPAAALPMLQLDIAGGYYDAATETIIASSQEFTLLAILTPQSGTGGLGGLFDQTFYISAALVPKVGPGGQALGSFTFDGTSVDATGGMTYGNPPLEDAADHDGGDLPPHGVFETYYREFPFTFSPTNTTGAYNTETSPGGLPLTSDGTAYYASFTVNTVSLDPAYTVHFDLYDEAIVQRKNDPTIDVDVDDFAPFSHDAQSPPPPPPPVPEPATLVLFAVAAGGALTRRRFRG